MKFNSISDLERINFGGSVPKHSVLLLYWFADNISENYGEFTLIFDPNFDFGSHPYRNIERLLDQPPSDHRYYTVGNLNEGYDFPEYVQYPASSFRDGENRDRIVFSAQRLQNGRYRIHRVFLTQHGGQNNRSAYDPEHTYEISTELLRQIRNRSRDSFVNIFVKPESVRLMIPPQSGNMRSDDRSVDNVRPQSRQTEENRDEATADECGAGADECGAEAEECEAEAGCSSQFHSDTEDTPPQKSSSSAAKARSGHSCPDCGKEFKRTMDLRRHVLIHTGEKPHKCSVCEKCFTQKGALTKHLKTQHHMCPVCKTCCSDDVSLKEHLTTHVDEGAVDASILKAYSCSDPRPFSCSECGKKFRAAARLSGLRKKFTRKCDLNRHVVVHSGERPHVCHVCDKDFTRMSELTQHQKHVHHMCPVCKQCFPESIKLNQHLDTHVQDGSLNQFVVGKKLIKRHLCSQCGKEFRSNSSLDKHMVVHTGAKPYKCSVCEEDFIFKFKRDQHLWLVHGTCSVCQQKFHKDADLAEHLQTHVEDGTVDPAFLERVNRTPYSCCGKSFEHKSHYDMHMLTHTGEKPYRCSVCEKCFGLKSTLNTHMRTHSGEKAFKCTLCEKTFTQKVNLQMHQRRHVGHTHFTCLVCERSFLTNADLQSHRSTHTQEEVRRASQRANAQEEEEEDEEEEEEEEEESDSESDSDSDQSANQDS
ncbi:hypothetical protein WMY93_006765 [Mugilogobius chulae]|uniref:C2H2-type domain-containing protein n=1 Tax=Mugilogobius chulae TaxID=88201 RepID=A0AAW0PLF7_9GOBI